MSKVTFGGNDGPVTVTITNPEQRIRELEAENGKLFKRNAKLRAALEAWRKYDSSIGNDLPWGISNRDTARRLTEEALK